MSVSLSPCLWSASCSMVLMWCWAVWRGYCIGRGIVGGFLLLFVVRGCCPVFGQLLNKKFFISRGCVYLYRV